MRFSITGSFYGMFWIKFLFLLVEPRVSLSLFRLPPVSATSFLPLFTRFSRFPLCTASFSIFFIPSPFPHPSSHLSSISLPEFSFIGFFLFSFYFSVTFSIFRLFFPLFRSLNPLFYPFSFVHTFYFSVPRLPFGSRSLSLPLIPSSL